MDKVRIGIIGVGIIAEQHFNKYKNNPDCEIVAACDIDPGRLDMMCAKHGVQDKYDNISRLLERDDIDAVDVCLHNCLHAPVAIAALRAGKDVYCEKPMAGSYFDAAQLYQAMQETGRKLHVQLNMLYNYETAVAKELIDAGELGHIYHLRSSGYRRRGRPFVDGYANKEFVNSEWSGGGALFDMGVYYISQLLYLMKNPAPLRITGRIYQETGMDEKRRMESGYDVEEFAVGLVDFADGLTLNVTEAWAVHMNKFEGSSILGSKGGIRLNPLSYHTNFHDFQMDSQFDQEAAKYRETNVYPERLVYRDSQSHWIASLQGKCPLLPTADIALNTQLIQEGIYLSSSLGRQVDTDEVKALSRSTARNVPNLD